MTVESTCGQPPPDVRFRCSANGFLSSCGATGRSASTDMQLADLADRPTP